MKVKVIIAIVAVLAIAGATLYAVPEHKDRQELYGVTDPLVKGLETTYESYGLIGVAKFQQESEHYVAIPFGRMIGVNYTDKVKKINYDKLLKVLQRHYKGRKVVNNIFINEAGSITIDCRN